MSKIKLPKMDAMRLPHGVSFDFVPSALQRWNESVVAKENEEEKDNTISIYDPIGFDPWTGGGVTAKRIAAALRSIGKKNVVVNINSPGGDLFEGLAIYNLLRDHDGEVTVRVVGVAASAASIIAMAGDRVEVARAGFLMIHNSMVVVIGNRNDLRDAADWIEQFDDAMAGIYVARSEKDKKEIEKMMDKETWMSGEQAVDAGFADALLPADMVEEHEEEKPGASIRALDARLARRGIPRSERRALINAFKELFGTQDAADPQDRGTQDAAPKATQDAGAVEAKAKQLVDSFTESLQT